MKTQSNPKKQLPEYHIPFERESVSLPDNKDENLFTGCKKARNINRFHDRTAGILAMVRPCGIIVNFNKMFTCESPTQAYIFIYQTFGRSLQDLTRLRYLGYDRTCDLHPFLQTLAKKGSLGAKILLDNVKMIQTASTTHTYHSLHQCMEWILSVRNKHSNGLKNLRTTAEKRLEAGCVFICGRS